MIFLFCCILITLHTYRVPSISVLNVSQKIAVLVAIIALLDEDMQH